MRGIDDETAHKSIVSGPLIGDFSEERQPLIEHPRLSTVRFVPKSSAT